MKKTCLIAVALIATMTVVAQNIAAVSPSNATTIFQTLDEAIEGAANGSTIYLPGGGFQIKNETQINKKLTIMGVSHRGDTDNVDGATVISGNLIFVKGSSGSAVLGVYLSGNIRIGTETDAVNNITARYCNINHIGVCNSNCSGIVVNQCYLRKGAYFGNSSDVRFENNISDGLGSINGGVVDHNIIWGMGNYPNNMYCRNGSLAYVINTIVTNNFFLNWNTLDFDSNNGLTFNNCVGTGSMGENPIILGKDKTWDDVFYANKGGENIHSDYRLKGEWGKNAATDGTDIGIYGGSGFKDSALTPIPRIVSKKVDESTDSSGKLQIEIKVKAQ